MGAILRRWSRACGWLLMTLASFSPAHAQSTYPFNGAIYKSSHNSYDRDETLAQQIDDYNVWQIELDLCTSDEGLKVSHTCDAGTLASARTLKGSLATLLANSRTYSQKFTLVYFDLKQNWADDANAPANTGIYDEILSTIKALFGTHLYTPGLLAVDKDWPSFKALNGRGYYFAVVVDWHGAAHTPNAARDDPDLFTVSVNNPPAQEFWSAVLVNVDGGCDASPTSKAPTTPRGRWLYRYWPSCGQDCPQMNGAYWTNAVSKGYTFIATNCVNWDHTFQPPTQSPQPLFVTRAAAVSCPNGYTTCEWGTLGFPFHDLGKALQRASPLTTVSVGAGSYTLGPGPVTLNAPLTLTASGGAATLN